MKLCLALFLPLYGKQFQLPAHYHIRLGKKPVTADVHAVAFVIYGFGNAANVIFGLEYDGLNIRMSEQFEGRSKACRPGSYNDRFFLIAVCQIAAKIAVLSR